MERIWPKFCCWLMLELNLKLRPPDSEFKNTSIIVQSAYIPEFLRENDIIYSGKNLHNESEPREEEQDRRVPPAP